MEGSIRKRGSKWYYSFEAASIDGKRKRIERVGGTTKKEAESALRKALEEYNQSGISFTPSEISVADFFNNWLATIAKTDYRHNTYTGYRNIVSNHINPKLGQYKLKNINTAVLNDFILGIYNNGYTKNMLVHVKSALSVGLQHAQDSGYILFNPADKIKMPSYKNGGKQARVREAITAEQFNTIIERFPEESNFYIPLMIGFYAGLRISECFGLTWDDIDFENSTLTVDKQLQKNEDLKVWTLAVPKTYKSTRVISIGDTLMSALKKEYKMQKENELRYGEYYTVQEATIMTAGVKQYCVIRQHRKDVGNVGKKLQFVNIKENGELLTTESFKYASRVIRYELGFSNFDYHTLRHTHATILIENGANVKEVSERLGHDKIDTTLDIYTSVTDKMKKESVDIFENAVKKDLPTA